MNNIVLVTVFCDGFFLEFVLPMLVVMISLRTALLSGAETFPRVDNWIFGCFDVFCLLLLMLLMRIILTTVLVDTFGDDIVL